MENEIFISWYVLPGNHLFSETFPRKGMEKKLFSVINHLYSIRRANGKEVSKEVNTLLKCHMPSVHI